MSSSATVAAGHSRSAVRPSRSDRGRASRGFGRGSSGNGGANTSSKPTHDRCGATLARLYYTVYDKAAQGSRILPLMGWRWCERCETPVKIIQRDMVEMGAAEATVVPRRQRRGRN